MGKILTLSFVLLALVQVACSKSNSNNDDPELNPKLPMDHITAYNETSVHKFMDFARQYDGYTQAIAAVANSRSVPSTDPRVKAAIGELRLKCAIQNVEAMVENIMKYDDLHGGVTKTFNAFSGSNCPVSESETYQMSAVYGEKFNNAEHATETHEKVTDSHSLIAGFGVISRESKGNIHFHVTKSGAVGNFGRNHATITTAFGTRVDDLYVTFSGNLKTATIQIRDDVSIGDDKVTILASAVARNIDNKKTLHFTAISIGEKAMSQQSLQENYGISFDQFGDMLTDYSSLSADN